MSTLGTVEIVKSRGRLRLEASASSPPANVANIGEIDDIDNTVVLHGNGIESWDESVVTPEQLWKSAVVRLEDLNRAEGILLNLPLEKQLPRLQFLLDKMISAIECSPPEYALGAIAPYDYDVAFLIEATGLADERGISRDRRPVFDRVEIPDSQGLPDTIVFTFTDPYDQHTCRVNLDLFYASASPSMIQRANKPLKPGEKRWRMQVPSERLADAEMIADLLTGVKGWREYSMLLTETPVADDDDFKPASWFKDNTKVPLDRLRYAAQPGRKTKTVRRKTIAGVPCYSVSDAKRWWPGDMKRA